MNEEKVIKTIKKSKNNKKSYGGTKYDIGYHSIELNGKKYIGQRDNTSRLSNVKYDFKNKVVLDIGCNVGGMLHEISHLIKYGVGIDNNYNCINAANLIKDYNRSYNINFYVFDLNRNNIDDIVNYVLSDTIDICFFLSMIKWVKEWTKLIKFCKKVSNNLLVETNGKNQDEQERIIKDIYQNVFMIYDKSLDDELQHKRRLFLCG